MTLPHRSRAAALLALALLGLVAPSAGADPDQPRAPDARPRDPVGLVRDVNPGPRGVTFRGSIALGGRLLLSLDDRRHGRELWRTDGSARGTVLVADLNPGRAGGSGRSGSAPRGFTRIGDRVYFFANDGVHRTELWRTDGTRAGTTRVTDVPGPLQVLADETAVVGRTLYFVAEDPRRGRELWRTDGSAAGARLVADVRPGPESSYPGDLTAYDGRLLFSADDGVHGQELWSTDGTTGGTALLADVRAEADEPTRPVGSGPRELTRVGGTVYFAADDDGDGEQLWSTDGTGAGTTQVRTTTPVGPVYLEGLTPLGDRLVYLTFDDRDGLLGRSRLWSASAGRTRTITDVSVEDLSADAVDGALLLAAGRGQLELWRTDGTAAGTRVVGDLAPGAPGSSPQEFTRVGGRWLFVAGRGDERGIWSSDGTARGTRRVAVVDDDGGRPTAGYPYEPRHLAAAGGALYFEVDDEVYGSELWSTAPAAGRVRRLDSTARPRVVGRPEVGSVLRVAPGRWTPATGLRRSYRWYVDGRVTGRASRTFRLGTAQAGSVVRVRELVARPGWRSQISYSAPTRPIQR